MTLPQQFPVVLVTGAARRIGAAIVRALHADGWRVLIHHRRSAQAARQLAAELNAVRAGSAATLAADLLEVDALGELAARAHARFGRLDALVNNASGYYATPFAQLTASQLDELLTTNFKAPLLLTRALLAYFGPDARVVNVLDTLAHRARPGFIAYGSAKAALWAATATLAAELAPAVRVNGVAPGHILWAETVALGEAGRRRELERVPLGRLGTPQEVAAAVRFLLSPQADYLTGTILPVDGGLCLR
ncbi:MAG: SDR family oxidoreductase [Gammaproteobacteria bacterium]|nr:SDR family oxidoreductase [Gammaproteobacteria bacterium]